jgi:plasmid replication initiation protein
MQTELASTLAKNMYICSLEYRDAGWAKEIKKKIGTVVYAECDRFASPALDGDG